MTDEPKLSELRRQPSVQRGGSAKIARPAVRWKTRVLLPGVMVLSVVGLLAYSAGDVLRPAVIVEVLPVVMKSSGDHISVGGIVAQAPGWVEPLPFAVSVPALADGIVQEVLVLEGQEVKAGQVVARLIDADARIALARAEAEVAQSLAELAAAEVAAGQAGSESAKALSLSLNLAQSPEVQGLAEARLELERLPSQIAVQEARLAELRTEMAAKTQAAESAVISSVPVDLLRARVEAQDAEVKGLHVQGKILSSRMKRLEVQVAVDFAKAQAVLLTAQAGRDEARLRLERMEIRAPTSGVVLARNVEPGTTVMTGASATPVVRLYDPDRLQVRVDVPLSTAAKVGLDQEAEIIVDVLPEQVFRGRVLRVVHEADIQRNTLQFKVSIEAPSPMLKPEMLARVRFLGPSGQVETGAGDERVFAPTAVVGSEPQRTLTVWVADLGRNVARQRTVTLGLTRLRDLIEVRSGLSAGDRVIVSPPAGLKEGRRIRVKGELADGSH